MALRLHGYANTAQSATYQNAAWPKLDIGEVTEAAIADFLTKKKASCIPTRYKVFYTWTGLESNAICGATVPDAALLHHSDGTYWDMTDVTAGYLGEARGVHRLINPAHTTVLGLVYTERQRLAALGYRGICEDETSAWLAIPAASFTNGDVAEFQTYNAYVDAYIQLINLVKTGRFAAYPVQPTQFFTYTPSLGQWWLTAGRLRVADGLHAVSSEGFPQGYGLFPNWAAYADVAAANTGLSTTKVYEVDASNVKVGTGYDETNADFDTMEQLKREQDKGYHYQFFTHYGSGFVTMPDWIQAMDVNFNINTLWSANGVLPSWCAPFF